MDITTDSYKQAIIELKSVLDHVFCFFDGANGLPLTNQTKLCLAELEGNELSSNLPDSEKKGHGINCIPKQNQSEGTHQQNNLDIKTPTKLQHASQQDFGDGGSSEKDSLILKLKNQVAEQQRDIEDLETELHENQEQILKLREEIRQKKMKKYTEASDLAGLKRSSSIYNKSKRRSKKVGSIRYNSIYVPRVNTLDTEDKIEEETLENYTNNNIESETPKNHEEKENTHKKPVQNYKKLYPIYYKPTNEFNEQMKDSLKSPEYSSQNTKSEVPLVPKDTNISGDHSDIEEENAMFKYELIESVEMMNLNLDNGNNTDMNKNEGTKKNSLEIDHLLNTGVRTRKDSINPLQVDTNSQTIETNSNINSSSQTSSTQQEQPGRTTSSYNYYSKTLTASQQAANPESGKQYSSLKAANFPKGATRIRDKFSRFKLGYK
ncbi:hypothetical protein BB558_002328 [Smittium angustum]|uniref:Uncharacterized protein n=1 Tax=Smittium angustum TaxID=133377 RepID=A0A2U1J9D0_SMIAN|nr:hypothetical protein BB558_002328 [Smittium angustum]